jgi:hypothetical protein
MSVDQRRKNYPLVLEGQNVGSNTQKKITRPSQRDEMSVDQRRKKLTAHPAGILQPYQFTNASPVSNKHHQTGFCY